jgi:hypothetical protein
MGEDVAWQGTSLLPAGPMATALLLQCSAGAAEARLDWGDGTRGAAWSASLLERSARAAMRRRKSFWLVVQAKAHPPLFDGIPEIAEPSPPSSAPSPAYRTEKRTDGHLEN